MEMGQRRQVEDSEDRQDSTVHSAEKGAVMETIRIAPLNSLCDKWKDFDENYLVGDDGHLYRRLKSGYYRSEKYGYQQVRGRFGTHTQHTVQLSRAVALAFLENPEGLTDVDHINNDKTDNRAENLQWLTHKDNLHKMFKEKKEKRSAEERREA